MVEQIIMQIAIMEKATEELKNFKMEVNEKSPCWFVLARKAKYEFMKRVCLEMPNFIFNVEECEAILEHGRYLETCWDMWNRDGGTIQDAMESAAEAITDIYCDGTNDDEDDEIDEEDCIAVLII